MSRSDLHEDEDDGNTDAAWPRREAARLRQIGIGKARPEYRRYMAEVAIDQREAEHPRTPDYRARDVSKRQFDRALGDWRRKLHEFAASRDAPADGEILRSSRARRPGSGRAGAAPRSDSEDAADGPQWRPKPEMLSGSVAPASSMPMSSPQAAQGATLSGAQSAGASVVQIKLADQLPQMAGASQMGPGQALQSQGAPQMADGFPWGWSDPQDMQMSWLPPPAEEQMDHVWSAWHCDGANDLMTAWTPPADFFETPQKMPPRLPDEWTPPKPDFSLDLLAQENMQELWQWEQTMACGPHGFSLAPTPAEIPSVPPLPVGSGTSTPPLTPRQKKPQNPAASPVPYKTPTTRVKSRVPMSAGGQTSLPATPQLNRWVQETPSPQRMYLAQPINRVPFAEIPASVFPLPETEPPPWT